MNKIDFISLIHELFSLIILFVSFGAFLPVIQGYTITNLGLINAENLRAAHKEIESGESIGKIVLEGF
jgi:hypothetical protein